MEPQETYTRNEEGGGLKAARNVLLTHRLAATIRDLCFKS